MQSPSLTNGHIKPAGSPARPLPTTAIAKGAGPSAGLQVRQVLHHVAMLMAKADPPVAIDRLVEVAEVCGGLLSIRRQLFIALNAHQRIERLSHVAHGREQALGTSPCDTDSMRSVEGLMQSCVNDVLGQWRRLGQTFTRLTHLLPTQLDHLQGFPAALTTIEQQMLMSRFVRVLDGVPNARFEAALDVYMGAQRRCQARVAPALAARERRRRAELDLRGASAAMGMLAIALFEEFLSRQSLLVAEGERASACFVLHLLVDAPAALCGRISGP